MTRARLMLIALTATIATQLVAIGAAQANCAIFDYRPEVDEESGQVVICGDGRSCIDGDVLIRENIETGEVVELVGNCNDSTYSSCFVDECVPAGIYRYGTAQPLQCGCGIQVNFVEVEMTTTLESCVPSNSSVPVILEGGAPWGDEASEDCTMGCAVASDPTHIGFPAFAIVGLVGLTMLIRRRRNG